jgi:ubiquitin thioesterase OTU1
MRIRLRGPSGASTIILDEDATVGDLRTQITDKTSLTKFDIKYSYPPRPLQLGKDATLLSTLDIRLDGEQLTISSQEGSQTERGIVSANTDTKQAASQLPVDSQQNTTVPPSSVSFTGMQGSKETGSTSVQNEKQAGPVSLQRKGMSGDVPELPLPDRGATMGM